MTSGPHKLPFGELRHNEVVRQNSPKVKHSRNGISSAALAFTAPQVPESSQLNEALHPPKFRRSPQKTTAFFPPKRKRSKGESLLHPVFPRFFKGDVIEAEAPSCAVANQLFSEALGACATR